MSTKPVSSSPEESAVQWPPAEYRQWVQTQVANRMLLQISAIGIGTLIALTTAYVGMQKWINSGLISEIKESVKEGIQGDITSQILNIIAERNAIIETVRKDITSIVNDEVESKISSPEFSEELRDRINEYLRPEDILNRTIIDKGWELAENKKLEGDRRALGLQLATLFQSTQQATMDDTVSIRHRFIGLAREEVNSPTFMAIVFNNYPLGQHDACSVRVLECQAADNNILDAVLWRAEKPELELPQALLEAYVNLFRQMPDLKLPRVAEWMVDHPERGQFSDGLINLWASSRDQGFMARLADQVTSRDMTIHGHHPTDLAARIVLKLPADAEISPEVRRRLISRLWAALPDDAAIGAVAFQPDPAMTADHQRPQLLRRAIINLLRTSAPIADNDQGSEHPPADDWDSIMIEALKFGVDEAATAKLAGIWADRLIVDAEGGGDIRLAAGRLLQRSRDLHSGFYQRSEGQRALSLALPYADSETIKMFGDSYISALDLNNKSRDPVLITMINLLSSKISGEFISQWLSEKINNDNTDIQNFIIHHLVIHENDWFTITENSNTWFVNIANYIRRHLDNNLMLGERRLAFALFSRLLGGINQLDSENYWLVIYEIERIVAQHDILNTESRTEIREHLQKNIPWILDRPQTQQAMRLTDAYQHRHTIEIPEQFCSDGGCWAELDFDIISDHRISIVFDENNGIEIAIYDKEFRPIGRIRNNEHPRIHFDQPMIIAVRSANNKQITEASVDFSVREVLGPSSDTAPHKRTAGNSVFELDTGSEGGELWFALEVEANQRITVETGPVPGSDYDIDTVVHLIDPASGRSLDTDDDGSSWRYSRLQYVAPADGEALFRIVEFGDLPFEPDMGFIVHVSVTDPTIIEPPARLEFLATDSVAESLYHVSVKANQRIIVETGRHADSPHDVDTVVSLVDAATGRQLAFNDDGWDMGRFSRLQHIAWRDTDALLGITQYGGEPFEPGTGFVVDVDVVDVPAASFILAEWPARVDFEATPAMTEGLYRVTLNAGQTITVETGGARDGWEIDTVVYLLDATTGEEIAWNDDGDGIGLYSRVIHTAPSQTDLVIRIVELGDRPFAPGTRFTVYVDVSPRAQRAESSRQSE